jgi:hypothetical protein
MTREEYWINELTHLSEEHGAESCAILLAQQLENDLDESEETAIVSKLYDIGCPYALARFWDIAHANRNSGSTALAIDHLLNLGYPTDILCQFLLDVIENPEYDEIAKAESIWTMARLYDDVDSLMISHRSRLAKWALSHEHPALRQAGAVMSQRLNENRDLVKLMARKDKGSAFGFTNSDHAREVLEDWGATFCGSARDPHEYRFDIHPCSRPIPLGPKQEMQEHWVNELNWFGNEYDPCHCSLLFGENPQSRPEIDIVKTAQRLPWGYCVHSRQKLEELLFQHPNQKVKSGAKEALGFYSVDSSWGIPFLLHIWNDTSCNAEMKANALTQLQCFMLDGKVAKSPELVTLSGQALKHPSVSVRSAGIRLSFNMKVNLRKIKSIAIHDHSRIQGMTLAEIAQDAINNWDEEDKWGYDEQVELGLWPPKDE